MTPQPIGAALAGPANRYIATFTSADAVNSTVRIDNPVRHPGISVRVLSPEVLEEGLDVWRSADVIEIRFHDVSRIAAGEYTVVIIG